MELTKRERKIQMAIRMTVYSVYGVTLTMVYQFFIPDDISMFKSILYFFLFFPIPIIISYALQHFLIKRKKEDPPE